MKDIPVADVRNFVLVGHTGSGKTSLVDSLLYKLGVNDRLGNPGTARARRTGPTRKEPQDFDLGEAVRRGLAPQGRQGAAAGDAGHPGLCGFLRAAGGGDGVADAALITVDATAGVQVGTVRAWKRCEALGLPRAIAITGLDKENADFDGTVAALQDLWGARCEVVTFRPTTRRAWWMRCRRRAEAAAIRARLTDVAAESSDALIEKVLGGETLTADELAGGLRASVTQMKFIPIFALMARQSIGLDELMSGFARLMPSPRTVREGCGRQGGESGGGCAAGGAGVAVDQRSVRGAADDGAGVGRHAEGEERSVQRRSRSRRSAWARCIS
jgi:elongation factor G